MTERARRIFHGVTLLFAGDRFRRFVSRRQLLETNRVGVVTGWVGAGYRGQSLRFPASPVYNILQHSGSIIGEN